MEKKESKQKSPKDTEDAGRIINIVSHQLKRTIFFLHLEGLWADYHAEPYIALYPYEVFGTVGISERYREGVPDQ